MLVLEETFTGLVVKRPPAILMDSLKYYFLPMESEKIGMQGAVCVQFFDVL